MSLPPPGPPQSVFSACYRHPDRETGLRCTRCERPICPQCATSAAVGFQCPECIGTAARSTRQAKTAFGGSQAGQLGQVTRVLIIVNFVIFAISTLWGLAAGGSLFDILVRGESTPATLQFSAVPYWQQPMTEYGFGGIASGEFYRLITADFLHYGLLHIGLNMYVLWIVGRETERLLGRWRYLVLYLLAGLGGSVAGYLFGQANSAPAGASASIFGLFAALFFFFRRMQMSSGGIVALIVLNLVITFTVPDISILGHLGGLAVGALVGAGIAFAPNGPSRTKVQVAVMVAVGLALLAAVVVRTVQLGLLGSVGPYG